jgi:hypothetical protein
VGLNDREDAFRHAYASYVLALSTSRTFAQAAGDAHERSFANSHNERVMDLYNNNIGRRLTQIPANVGRPAVEVIREALNSRVLMSSPLNIAGNPISHGIYHDYKKW